MQLWGQQQVPRWAATNPQHPDPRAKQAFGGPELKADGTPTPRVPSNTLNHVVPGKSPQSSALTSDNYLMLKTRLHTSLSPHLSLSCAHCVCPQLDRSPAPSLRGHPPPATLPGSPSSPHPENFPRQQGIDLVESTRLISQVYAWQVLSNFTDFGGRCSEEVQGRQTYYDPMTATVCCKKMYRNVPSSSLLTCCNAE